MIRKIFYLIKPLIPRNIQVSIRRYIIKRQRRKFKDIWPIDKRAKSRPEGWQGWPDQKKFAVVLTHDVENKEGQSRCKDVVALEERYGFRSSFNFVPERYQDSPQLRQYLMSNGFEVGVHGLNHDGKLFKTEKIFKARASRINQYLKDWNAVGFRAPAMHHNLEWIHKLNIEYDASTFDTDPFEPQPDGVTSIFPFWVPSHTNGSGFVELPYTLVQDFTLFILMNEKNIKIWKQKLDWIALHGGMVLVNVHPDYMNFGDTKIKPEEFPARYYEELLNYVNSEYAGQYWNGLAKDVARYYKKKFHNYRDRIGLNFNHQSV
jgi:hypothetical protein